MESHVPPLSFRCGGDPCPTCPRELIFSQPEVPACRKFCFASSELHGASILVCPGPIEADDPNGGLLVFRMKL